MIDESWYARPDGTRDRTSAGGVVARREAGRLLIALVREAAYPDYVLPKGGVKKGEDREQAARREIAEEAGLTDLTLLGDLGTRTRLSFSRKRWITTHYFLFTTGQRDGTPTDRKRRYVTGWFPLDNLPPFLWPEQKELIEKNRSRIEELLNAD